jgi:transposase
MFTLSSEKCYLLYSQATDLRKSFDSLSGIIRDELMVNPQSGDVYLFINKNRDKVKLLHWSGGSFTIYYKRLERGTFELPRYDKKIGSIRLDYARLVMLLDGLSVKNLVQRKRYNSA